MKKILFCLLVCVCCKPLLSQNLQVRLTKAVNALQKDSQMSNALMGFYVVDISTGDVIFASNENAGLAPASTQKVVTAAAALSILGTGYTYTTEVFYDGIVKDGVLNGNLYIKGNGDPTLGSWRYPSRPRLAFIDSLKLCLNNAGIYSVKGNVYAIDAKWESQTIPGGWIWDDVGNYYGAGVAALNWNENQYDLILNPGREGDIVQIVRSEPILYGVNLISELTAASPSSGDNGYIYLPPYAQTGYVRGTVPAGKSFKISGSVSMPVYNAVHVIADELSNAGLYVNGESFVQKEMPKSTVKSLLTYSSLSLDSMIYWFLNKSVNFYGETFVKTIALQKNGFASTDKGIQYIRNFWTEQGIEKAALKVIDGSGLSPQNHVSAKALTQIMTYNKKQSWFNAFYAGLPLLNNIKMKSGTIAGAKSFTGYVTSNSGKEYAFAIIINNFNGASSAITQKMYRVLDELKQ